MTAREEMLARVRAAASGRPVSVPARASGPSRAGDVDLFVARVADYRAVVERCRVEELAEVIRRAVGGRSVVAPHDLGIDVSGAVVDEALSATDLDAVDTVVTRSALGIAETGTIVLDHAEGQGRRVISLVPDRHVCIVRAADVVADVPDAVQRLAPAVSSGRPLTWISGPSATSDIELDRVEGVHGPRDLHVIVVT